LLILGSLVVLELRVLLVFDCHLRVQCTDTVDVVLGLLLLLLVDSHLVLAQLLRTSEVRMRAHLNDASLLELLNLHLLLGRELATLHVVGHGRLVDGLLLLHVAAAMLPLVIVSVSILIIRILHLGLVAGIVRPEEGLALWSHPWLQILFSLLPAKVLAWVALIRRHAKDRRRGTLHVTLAILRLVRLSELIRII
jgi:hypothetical protein